MARVLSQRHSVLFAIAVLMSIAYLVVVELLPRNIGAFFKALPLVWFIPAAASFCLFVIAWRNETTRVRAKYFRATIYGLLAPVVGVLLFAIVLVWVVGWAP
jgi:hypothetical protein